MLEAPPLRDIRGVGVADPELVELSINENPLGPPRRAIEEVAKRMFGMNRYIMDTPLEEALAKHRLPVDMVLTGVGRRRSCAQTSLRSTNGRNTVTGFPHPQIRGDGGAQPRGRRVKLRPD
jgi:histidinol-phosphate/aromatic aminotransferase/cobyric acid decarboxylase-like protein